MLAGTYLAEYGRTARISTVIRFVNDVLLSAPSIIIGLFVYELLVVRMGHFSALAGAVALAIIAMPVTVRTTEDMLNLVPQGMKDASTAMGAYQWRTITSVIYPAARSGIVTGLLLAVARISGETAPLLFTALNNQFWSSNLAAPMANLPVVIFQFALSPYPNWQQLAWSGALLITRQHPGTEHRRAPGGVLAQSGGQALMGAPQAELRAAPARARAPGGIKFDGAAPRFLLRQPPHALKDVNLTLPDRRITAFIGPSGCGKSTLLRVFNRMYALYPGHRATGDVRLDGEDILAPTVDVAALRFRVGMVFQKATPFPMSIFDNVAFGLRLVAAHLAQRAHRAGRGGAARCGDVGGGQGQAARGRPRALRRAAAAAVHRPYPGAAAGGYPVR